MIWVSDLLEEATEVLSEISRVTRLNMELLEVLSVTAQWVSGYAKKTFLFQMKALTIH